MRIGLISTAIAAAMAANAVPAIAATAITGFTGGTVNNSFTSNGSGVTTVGWYFTVDTTVQVTALGWYAVDTPPTSAVGTLDDPHQVGIWQGATLLGSAVVTPGSGGAFRYTSVAPITLLAGVQYIVAGADSNSDGDGYISDVSNLTTDGAINFLGSARSQGGDGFVAPTVLQSGSNGRFGANFQFDVVGGAVPEPATWAMSIAGFGLVGGAMRRGMVATRVSFAR